MVGSCCDGSLYLHVVLLSWCAGLNHEGHSILSLLFESCRFVRMFQSFNLLSSLVVQIK